MENSGKRKRWTLDASGVTDIVSFVDGQLDQEEDLDEDREHFNEDEETYNEEEDFNGDESFIEELPRQASPVEEINISDEELTRIWEDSTRHEDETQIDQDIIFINEELPKMDEYFLNSQSNLVLHPDITETWTVWTRSGIPLKDKEELLSKYAPPKFLKAPEINQEILVTLHKRPVDKDEYIRSSQAMLGSALTALGSTMSSLLSENDKSDKLKVLNSLNDTAKLLTELFHFDTEKRRSNIISWKPQPVQALLIGTKPDEFLFGRSLRTKVKEAQSSGRLGRLKPYVFKKNNNRPYKFFPSPYHWYGRGEEEEEEAEQQNFVLNPMKQEPKVEQFTCKKEEVEKFPSIKLE